MKDDAKRILDELHEARAAIDAAALERDALIDGLLTAEQRQQIREIKEEFAERTEIARVLCESLEAQARQVVKELGGTVKGTELSAIWCRPTTKWDTEGLLAMSRNPEFAWLREFMKQGEPRVMITKNRR